MQGFDTSTSLSAPKKLNHQGFWPRVRPRQELISGNEPADIREQLGVSVGVSTNLIISANCRLI
jgi:hypothetical protein